MNIPQLHCRLHSYRSSCSSAVMSDIWLMERCRGLYDTWEIRACAFHVPGTVLTEQFSVGHFQTFRQCVVFSVTFVFITNSKFHVFFWWNSVRVAHLFLSLFS